MGGERDDGQRKEGGDALGDHLPGEVPSADSEYARDAGDGRGGDGVIHQVRASTLMSGPAGYSFFPSFSSLPSLLLCPLLFALLARNRN